MSRQNESNPALWWLPEGARWSYLAHSGLPFMSPKKNFPKHHIINPLLTKLVQARWLDIGLIRFGEFMDLDYSILVFKSQKRHWPISSHLDPAHLVNNPYLQSISGTWTWKMHIIIIVFLLQHILDMGLQGSQQLSTSPCYLRLLRKKVRYINFLFYVTFTY